MKLESIDGIIITIGVVIFFTCLAGGMAILQKAYAEEAIVSVEPWMPTPYKWNQPPAVCLYGSSLEDTIGEQAVKEWQSELRNYTGLNDSWNLRVVKLDETIPPSLACNIDIHYWHKPSGYEFGPTPADYAQDTVNTFTKESLMGITMMRDLPQNCSGYGITPEQENTCLMKNWDHSWNINIYTTEYFGNGIALDSDTLKHLTEHELAHAFGIYQHYAYPSIMSNGYENLKSASIQEQDLSKIVKIYGDDWK